MIGPKSPLRTLAFALAFAAVFLLGRYVATLNPPHEDSAAISAALEQEAAELNATLPEQVSETVRLDKATAGPGNAFAYVYTIVDAPAARKIKSDPKKSEDLKAQLLERVCTMMPAYRERGTIVSYALRNEAGATLAEIAVDPKDCP